MEQRLTLHIVDASSPNRAELARTAFEVGYHAEVYSDVAELTRRPPTEGLVLTHDEPKRDAASAIEALTSNEIWLPVIAYAEQPQARRIVAAVKAGALEYLPWPLSAERLRATLALIGEEVEANQAARRRLIEARRHVAELSRREREVLDCLVEGFSNKGMARTLDISPRTVEIHRANMMRKLGARHAADAVRVRLEAQVESVLDISRVFENEPAE